MLLKKLFLIFYVLLLLVPFSLATDDSFKPYLHKAGVPESPAVRLFGQYSTNLFPGSATYSYPIEVPKGVNGLQPSVVVSYNSQSVKQRPGVLGAGWSLNQDLIYRDVNFTPDDTSDDKFIMILDGNMYELVLYGGVYHTEVDYWFRIEDLGDYWLVTKQDGTQYRFGYNADSELVSNTGQSYSLKWYLDQVEDTHGNKIYYSYSQNSYDEDSGAVYLSQIAYNSDLKRVVDFTYESAVRPDRRRVYDQGNLFEESRRLTDISIIVDDVLVRRHHFSYSSLGSSLSAVSKMTYYGSDNSSVLFNVSFDYYSSEHGFTNQTTAWKPPAVFADSSHSDYGVRLLDLNSDGFVDVIQAKDSGDNNSWINNKVDGWALDSSWKSSVTIVTSSGADEGVRFGDINKDGFDDLLKSNNGNRYVFLNNGHGWASVSWSIPFDFIDSSGLDVGAQVVDVNGDGRADLLNASAGYDRHVYLNTGSGWSLSSWSIPFDFVDAGVDQGVRLVDVNGDGLVDILKSSNLASAERQAWLNNGAGWVNSSDWLLPTGVYFTETSILDTGVRFADVNGDGLVDVLKDYANGTVTNRSAWLNTGSGWSQDSSWLAPDSFTEDGHNLGRRLADVDGDGFADFIVSDTTSGNYTWTKNSTLPYLLRSITNEYGGVTLINYTKSTQFNNTENSSSKIGFNIFVVATVSKNNSLSTDFNVVGSVDYNYSLGKYDYDKSEFRGFGLSTELKPGSVVNHYFYQDDARKGKEYQAEVYDTGGALFSKVVKDYNYTYENGIYNLSLRSLTEYSYDGSDSPVVRNKTFEYNVFGNPRWVVDYGDVDVVGDEKYYNYSYGFNFDEWIIDKVSRVAVLDADMNKVKETKYYYDGLGLNGVGSFGDLTKTEEWVEDGNNSYAWMDYDSYGNLIAKTDSLGNTYKYRYDDLNIFIEGIVNPLGHVTTYDYDAGTGNLLWSEKNGVRTSYDYDVFGRIVNEIKPYDSSSLPTKSYNYSFDGVAPEKITVKLKTTGNKTDNINYFYDGFADLVQVKGEIENGYEVVKNIFYDNEFRAGSEQNPYYAAQDSGLTAKSSSANVTNYSYDALDRVVFVLNSDGTNKTVVFDRYNVSDYDENSHRHTYTLDAFGRIVKVYEFVVDPFTNLSDVFVTNYDYDSNDNLVKIVDNEGHVFRFTYDALGRKTAMSDPDMGNWSYLYDTNKNLIKQTDGKGQIINLTYDALGRIKTKSSSDVNLSFGYDEVYYGTLSNLSVNNDTFFYFTYDDRLRVVRQVQNVSGVFFTDVFAYDSHDRLVSDGLSYVYAKNGMVGAVPGFVNYSGYNAFGSLVTRNYSNGLMMNYTYDSANNRLLSIMSLNVMSVNYSYDNVGNIMSISDGVTGRMQSMSYDYLDRLVRVTAGSDSFLYSYNSIGNLMKVVKNGASKKYVYNGLAHAPSKLIDGVAGVDLHNPHELDSDSKKRVFEFYLLNELSTNITPNFTVVFGDGNSFVSNVSFNVSDNAIVIVENNYSSGGDYVVNLSANGSGSYDPESMNIKFGARANDLSLNYSNIATRRFNLVILNDISETARSVVWNCSNGLSNLTGVNIPGNSNVSWVLEYNYSSPGDKSLVCAVRSTDGNDSLAFDFVVAGLGVKDYDVLYSNGSKRVVLFEAGNDFNRLETQINISTNGALASEKLNISAGDSVIVITETNYSSDGSKEYEISLTGNGSTTAYAEAFKLRGVDINDYVRLNKSLSTEVILFDVVNNWQSGFVNWSLSDPSITNSTSLNTGEGIAVIVENNYTSQGWTKPNVDAKVSSFTDFVRDLFESRPLGLARFEALALSTTKGVFELVARNDLGSLLNLSWRLNTGSENVSSNISLNISDDVFVIIESNYTSTGVYKTQAVINSSSYNDTQSGVAVI